MSTQEERNLNQEFTRHVGFEGSSFNRDNYQYLWSKEHLLVIQQKIAQLLQGVDKDNRPILVTLDVIGNVLSQTYSSNKPRVGDIYSRFILPEKPERNDIAEIVNRTIEIIVSQIKNEYQMIQQNNRLSIWNTVRGDFNAAGLRSHSQIKLRKKRPNAFQFHMNY